MDFQGLPRLMLGGGQDSAATNTNRALDNDYLPVMLASYLRKKKAVLIFCPSKNQCEQVAKKLST